MIYVFCKLIIIIIFIIIIIIIIEGRAVGRLLAPPRGHVGVRPRAGPRRLQRGHDVQIRKYMIY